MFLWLWSFINLHDFLQRQEDPEMGDFEGNGSLDGVIIKVSRRFNLIWIPPDQGYKLRPPGGLTDLIRKAKETPG